MNDRVLSARLPTKHFRVVGRVLPIAILIAVMEVVLTPQQPIRPPTLSPFSDQAHWVLREPLEYWILETDHVVEVPLGFVTDFASIPRALWAIAGSPHGAYSRAAVVHDYLYWDQRCTREQADNVMAIAMEESGVEDRHLGVFERDEVTIDMGAADSHSSLPLQPTRGLFRPVPQRS